MMSQKGRKSVKILGVKVDSTHIVEVIAQAREKIKKGTKFFIVTPNPEIVLNAQNDSELMRILNTAAISLPDGAGLVMADKFNRLTNPGHQLFRVIKLLLQGLEVGLSVFFRRDWLFGEMEVVRGREVFYELIKLANAENWKVYLVGGENNEAYKAKLVLTKKFRSLKIESNPGPWLNSDGKPTDSKSIEIEKTVIREISQFKPDLLFVGFGAPKQEKWLYRHIPELSIKCGMVVGGTFNYYSGGRVLPSHMFSNYGLEWVWRLFAGSQTIKRVWNALIIFPYKVYWYKLKAS